MGTEIWKDIPGYEDLYEISSLDRVRSLDKVNPITCEVVEGKLMKLKEIKSGMYVRLRKNGIQKGFTVSDLKEQAFLCLTENGESQSNDHKKDIENLLERYEISIDDLADMVEDIDAGMTREAYRKEYRRASALYRTISNKPDFIKWGLNNL